MLGRVLISGVVGGVMAAGCGGDGFQGGEVDGEAGESPGGTTSVSGGAPSAAGTATQAGAPAQAGTPSEGGSAGAPDVPPPSITVVQTSRTSIVGNLDPSLTLSQLPLAGNALIVGITCFTEVDNCLIPEGGVTDNQGNSYELVVEGSSIVSSDTHGSRGYLFIAENIAAPNGMVTITVNPTGTPPENYQNFAWGVLEVSGLLPQGSVDQTGIFPNSCCSASTTVETDGATTTANELAVAVHTARSNDNDFNYGHDPAWTEQQLNNDGVSLASQHSLVTRVLTETGVVSHTWTHDEPTRGVSAIIATFRGATD